MTTNSQMIQFLTNADNAVSVVEILRHSDAVREELFKQFWAALRTRLTVAEPKCIEKFGAHLRPDSERRGTSQSQFGISLYLSGDERQTQALHYRVEQYLSSAEFYVFIGLHWQRKLEPNPQILRLPEVVALAKTQRELGLKFDGTLEWHGWKWVPDSYRNRDEFLAIYHTDADMLLTVVTDAFWQHIEHTHAVVASANIRLQKIRDDA